MKLKFVFIVLKNNAQILKTWALLKKFLVLN